jgi:hypothetical protein
MTTGCKMPTTDRKPEVVLMVLPEEKELSTEQKGE